MAPSGLTMDSLADRADASERALETDLARPASPCAITVVRLGTGLGIGARLLSGCREVEPVQGLDVAVDVVFGLPCELKTDPELPRALEGGVPPVPG